MKRLEQWPVVSGQWPVASKKRNGQPLSIVSKHEIWKKIVSLNWPLATDHWPLITMQLTIPTPATFSFRRTAISHGWCELPPFELDRQAWTLTRVIDVGAARPLT